MNSPAEPASGDATQASQLTKPLRELAALVLLGANAVLLFVGLIRLLVEDDSAGSTFFAFVGVESTVLPVLAVLLATHVRPVVPKAKLITQVALGEYAAGALFGALTFLIWLVGRLADGEVVDALLGMLARVAWLAVFAVAGYVVYTIWRGLYRTPKPKPQAGVYGQPQQGWAQQQGGYPAPGQPGGYPSAGQPGGYPPPGQGGYPPPGQGGYPPPGQGGYPAAGGYPPPGQYGQPNPSAPPFNTAPPYGNAPQSSPPYGDPHSAPPFGQPPSADPTQTVPRQSGDYGYPTPHDDDRTRRFHRDDRNYPR